MAFFGVGQSLVAGLLAPGVAAPAVECLLLHGVANPATPEAFPQALTLAPQAGPVLGTDDPMLPSSP